MHDEKLKQFILASKPEWAKGIDVAVMCFLFMVADAQGKCEPLQDDLAIATGASLANRGGLRSSIERLHEHGWIVWTKKKHFAQRHSYVIQFDNLPR
jgi:hypothetical protein